MQKIYTERLILREIKSKDIFRYSELFSDREIMKQYGGRPIDNVGEIADLVNSKRKEYENGDSLFWSITENQTREFIGFVRLVNYQSKYFELSYKPMGDLKFSEEFNSYIERDGGWELDYALLKEYRNNGIMTEALKSVLDLYFNTEIITIYAKVNSLQNKGSIAVLAKFGFTELLPLVSMTGELGMIYKLKLT
jgi:RimJ/RimL family protein N-acetyltransferase